MNPVFKILKQAAEILGLATKSEAVRRGDSNLLPNGCGNLVDRGKPVAGQVPFSETRVERPFKLKEQVSQVNAGKTEKAPVSGSSQCSGPSFESGTGSLSRKTDTTCFSITSSRALIPIALLVSFPHFIRQRTALFFGSVGHNIHSDKA